VPKPARLFSVGLGVVATLLVASLLGFASSWSLGLILAVSIAVGVILGGLLYTLLYWVLERRIIALYDKLLQIRRRRLPDYPVTRQPDPIHGMDRVILELAVDFRHEIAEMREAQIVRQEFVGDISHELKTPIFAIEGFLETLLDGALEDEKVNRVFLTKALNNVSRLANLVNDLLTVSQLEAGHLSMNPEAFRIYELILDVAEMLEHKLTYNNRSVKLQVNSSVPERTRVRADRNRIQQVLINLVDNAIKYGKPDGQVTVLLDANSENQPHKLRITVQDDGPGIPAEDLPKIFDRFYRVEKSRARHAGGNGLGLSIVKSLVEAHKETLRVESRPGRTAFTFTLPEAEAR